MNLSGILQEKYMDRRCGTCARWREKPGEYGVAKTYCSLDGKERFSHEGKGCLRWKERKK